MGEHAAYWTGLTERGTAVVFGPVFDPAGVWGLAILDVADEAGASALTAADPVIRAAGVGASAGFAACGCADAAPPSTIDPSTAPGPTVSPSFATMSPSVPAAGALTSRLTLSVSSSTTDSSA